MCRTLAEAARRLNARAGRRGLPPLILMTDPRMPEPERLVAALPAGCMVVLRHYGQPDREALARRLSRLCRARRLRFVVAGDVRLAAALRADGLHLPEAMARLAARALAWRRARRGWLSAAAHSLPAVRRAARIGADAALLSPVFATASHPGARPLGSRRFAAIGRSVALPLYALGGVNLDTVAALRPARAAGIATVGGVARAKKDTGRKFGP